MSPATLNTLAKGSLVIGAALLVALVATFPLREQAASKAQNIQLVQKQDGSDIFGEPEYTKLGSPQMIIIEDPKAFLDKEEDGAKWVDDAYLKANNIYPVQLKSVDATLTIARYAFGFFGLDLLVLGWVFNRAAAKRSSPSVAA